MRALASHGAHSTPWLHGVGSSLTHQHRTHQKDVTRPPRPHAVVTVAALAAPAADAITAARARALPPPMRRGVTALAPSIALELHGLISQPAVEPPPEHRPDEAATRRQGGWAGREGGSAQCTRCQARTNGAQHTHPALPHCALLCCTAALLLARTRQPSAVPAVHPALDLARTATMAQQLGGQPPPPTVESVCGSVCCVPAASKSRRESVANWLVVTVHNCTGCRTHL